MFGTSGATSGNIKTTTSISNIKLNQTQGTFSTLQSYGNISLAGLVLAAGLSFAPVASAATVMSIQGHVLPPEVATAVSDSALDLIGSGDTVSTISPWAPEAAAPPRPSDQVPTYGFIPESSAFASPTPGSDALVPSYGFIPESSAFANGGPITLSVPANIAAPSGFQLPESNQFSANGATNVPEPSAAVLALLALAPALRRKR